MFVAYLVIGISSNIYVVSIFQVLLSTASFGAMGFIFWAICWCPLANVRNTLKSISYNLGLALFVSSQFDVETYLADLDASLGCLFAGLYISMFVVFSAMAIYGAEKFHSWDRYRDH